MDKYIKQRLDDIEQTARQILRDIQSIYGFCEGMATVANDFPRQDEYCPSEGQINGLIDDKKTKRR